MKQRVCSMMAVIMACLLFLTSYASAAVDEDNFFADFTAVANPDGSVTVEGIFIPKTIDEAKISLKDAGGETIVSTTVALNADGFFSYTTEPLNRAAKGVYVYAGKGQFAIGVGRSRSKEIEKYKWSVLRPFDAAQTLAEIDQWKRRIAAADRTSYAVDDQGQLWAWGRLSAQLCGADKSAVQDCDRLTPQKIAGVTKVRQIAANGGAGAVLTQEGVIQIWGVSGAMNTPLRIAKMTDAVQVEIDSRGDGMVLKRDGTAYQWNVSAIPAEKLAKTPVKFTKIASLPKIKKLKISAPSLYGTTYLALDEKGAVWAWGDITVIDSANQKGNKDNKGPFYLPVSSKVPKRLTGFPKIRDLETNDKYPLLVGENSELWSYVNTDHTFVNVPGKVADGVAAVFKGSPYVLKNDGRFYRFTSTPNSLSTEPAGEFNDYALILYGASIYSGSDHSLGLKKDGTLVSWGSNSAGQLGIGKPNPFVSKPQALDGIKGPKRIAAGGNHVLALTNDGSLYGWGRNEHQEVRAGSAEDILAPSKIGTYRNAKKIEAGNGFSLLLTDSGELLAWGDKKRLGMEGVSDPGTPEKVGFFTEPVTDISAYGSSAVALTRSGKVYHLGVFDDHSRSESGMIYRIQEVEMAGAVSVAAGGKYGWAVKNDGTVWQWTWEWAGDRIAAKKIEGFTQIVQLAPARANGDYLLALDRQGNLWGWGDNSASQLGKKVPTKLNQPRNITDKPLRITANAVTESKEKLSFASLSASRHGALAVTRGGEMLFFGYLAGLLRDTKLYQNVKLVETGGENMYWVVNDRLYVLGSDNQDGQLGVGTKEHYDTPETVVTSTGAAFPRLKLP